MDRDTFKISIAITLGVLVFGVLVGAIFLIINIYGLVYCTDNKVMGIVGSWYTFNSLASLVWFVAACLGDIYVTHQLASGNKTNGMKGSLFLQPFFLLLILSFQPGL
jgi:hypothetical protein